MSDGQAISEDAGTIELVDYKGNTQSSWHKSLTDRPEILVGAAFIAGIVLATLLKRRD